MWYQSIHCLPSKLIGYQSLDELLDYLKTNARLIIHTLVSTNARNLVQDRSSVFGDNQI